MKLLLLAGLALSLAAQTPRREYSFRGKVVEVSIPEKKLTVANEAIEGWMGAMTMGYAVENAEVLPRIHPGDQITAKVYEGDFTLHAVALASSNVQPDADRVAGLSATQPRMRLEELEAVALARHPALAEAEASRRIFQGTARQAGLLPNPTAGYYGDEIRGGFNGGGKQGGFISQSIVLGGKLGAARRVAAGELDQAAAGVDIQRARIRLAVRASFYKVLTAQRLVNLRERQADVAADTLQTARQLANIGQIERPDVLQAELEVQQAELGRGIAQQNLRTAWRTLATDVGNPDLPMNSVEGDLEALPELSYEQVADEALRQSPELILLQRKVSTAEASLDSARRVPIPDLALSAILAHNFEPLESTGRPTGLQGGAQIGVQIPLFNRNQGNIAAARAGIETARASLDREKLRIQRLMTALYADYANARETALRYRAEMLPRATQALEMYRSNYAAMAGPYTQVLMAQRNLFQLEADALRALESGWDNVLALQSYGVGASR